MPLIQSSPLPWRGLGRVRDHQEILLCFLVHDLRYLGPPMGNYYNILIQRSIPSDLMLEISLDSRGLENHMLLVLMCSLLLSLREVS